MGLGAGHRGDQEEPMDTTRGDEMTAMLGRLGSAWGWIVAYGVASLLAGVIAVAWPSSTLVDRDHLCGPATGGRGLPVCFRVCDSERERVAQGPDRAAVGFLFGGCDLFIGSRGSDALGACDPGRHLLDCTWCHRTLPCHRTFGGPVAAMDRDYRHPQHRRRRSGGDFSSLVSILPDDLPRILARPLRVDADRERSWPAIRGARSEADGPKSRPLS